MSFSGTADYTLDAKNRLTVPARYRGALANGVVVQRSLTEPSLEIWPAADHAEQASAALGNRNPLAPTTRELKRALYASVEETNLDGAGRIGLNAKQLAHAGLTKDVTVVGSGEWLEVWERDAWVAREAESVGKIADILEALEQDAG